MGCHFLLQCIRVKSESEVAQSCPTLSDLMNCSPPGSSIHGIFQARVLEWGAIAFSRPVQQEDPKPMISKNPTKQSSKIALHCDPGLVSPNHEQINKGRQTRTPKYMRNASTLRQTETHGRKQLWGRVQEKENIQISNGNNPREACEDFETTKLKQ